jgi:hypothetical protein
MTLLIKVKTETGEADMVDGRIKLTERQKRALVAHQFELQMPKYPLSILERLTNYRYRMYEEEKRVEMLAATLASSFDFYEYRMNLKGGIDLIVCQKHNSSLPVWVLEMETSTLYDPGSYPDLVQPAKEGQRKRRTQDEQKLLISQLIIGVQAAREELEEMEPRTRQRYLELRQRYLKTKPGRPWMS